MNSIDKVEEGIGMNMLYDINLYRKQKKEEKRLREIVPDRLRELESENEILRKVHHELMVEITDLRSRIRS